MIYAMILLFIAGYIFIAMEHTVKVNKAGVALLIGTLLWASIRLSGTRYRPHRLTRCL